MLAWPAHDDRLQQVYPRFTGLEKE
jgi:hypothetical protein